MNEKELGKMLLEGESFDAYRPPDPRLLARSIVSRDRRRLYLLAILAMFFWLAATGSVFGVAWYLLDEVFGDVVRDVGRHVDELTKKKGVQADPSPLTDVRAALPGPAASGRVIRDRYVDDAVLMIFVIGGTMGLLLLAAGFSVWLALATRKATLRQINASLMEIAAQLRELHRPAGAA